MRTQYKRWAATRSILRFGSVTVAIATVRSTCLTSRLVRDDTSIPQPLRVGMISLGCAKNLVDAEVMLGALLKEGMEITNHAAQADVMIVNTCSFIDAAQEESVDAILESSAVREAHRRGQGLVVSGCLPQRFPEELPGLLPEVDAFMGIDQVVRVGEIVRKAYRHRQARLRAAPVQEGGSKYSRGNGAGRRTSAEADPRHAPDERKVEVHARPSYLPDYETPRYRLTPPHMAYVKIAEGCNHPCSFCTIPRMRGSHRSRPLADVVAEVKRLVRQGVREINLISQDSTFYGLDLRPARSGSIAAPARFAEAAGALPVDHPTLAALLRQLERVPGDFWIRLLYTHPAHWTDELIRTMAECSKVVRYVDMPLQHIHENMLERMRRETSRQYIVDLIQRIRSGIPGIALRTTFIVGFPGETEASFESLLEFIRETRFERMGVFTYSQEAGTRAASMRGHVPEGIRKQRRDRAMAEQLRVSRSLAAGQVDRVLRVLVEREARGSELRRVSMRSWEHGFLRSARAKPVRRRGSWSVARSQADAPDIDGRVFVRGHVPAGEFATVRIVDHTDYDLVALPEG